MARVLTQTTPYICGSQCDLNKQGDPNSCASPSFVLDGRRVKRLLAELDVLQSLPEECPLLPRLYDAFSSREGRRAHLVLTHVPGTDLSCRLHAAEDECVHAAPRPPVLPSHVLLCPARRLRPVLARFFVAEVLLALEVIHEAGFVYRHATYQRSGFVSCVSCGSPQLTANRTCSSQGSEAGERDGQRTDRPRGVG